MEENRTFQTSYYQPPSQPGWNIEKRYNPDVLIGNWYEERRQFESKNYNHQSTHQTDFKAYRDAKPDVVIRRRAQINNAGLDRKFLFDHHNGRYNKNSLITWYDEHYNKRERPEGQKFPPLRSWDSSTIAWLPEKSDHPIMAEPTNWGLKESRMRDSTAFSDSYCMDDRFDTNYRVSYNPIPREAYSMTRYSAPREQSTSLIPFNKMAKNFTLRDGKRLLRMREPLLTTAHAKPVITPPNNCPVASDCCPVSN